jgi:hypothetical protein
MFELAEDLEEQVGELRRELQQIADTLARLTSLRRKTSA